MTQPASSRSGSVIDIPSPGSYQIDPARDATVLSPRLLDAALRVAASAAVDRYAFGVTGFRGLAARRLQVRLDVIAERI